MYASRFALTVLLAAACATTGFAQGSDSCATAQVIVGTGSFAFDNTAATTDGIGDALCQAAAHNQIYLDVWYSWVAPASGSYTFSTCGQTTLDSKIGVYNGSCAGAVLACNDDACGGLQSSLDVILTGGNTYIIRLGSYSQTTGGTGTFTITVTGQLAVLDTRVNPNNGKTYHLLSAGTWTAAEGTALSMGAHLVTINDATENAWIVSTWQNFGGTPRDLWIGINDSAVEGTFAWADGTPVSYMNWDPGEPNDGGGAIAGGEDFGEIRRDRPNGEWNDLTGSPSGYFQVTNMLGVVEEPGTSSTAFCTGDVAGVDCLGCGNNGAAGRGCANSSFAAGGRLQNSGASSISTDTMVLTASDIPGPGLFFQANGLAPTPVTFGDGMLCAAVGIIRMGVVFPTSGVASYPGGLTPNPIHIAGGPISAGDIKHYQCWYRDAVVFCTTSTFNLTNGLTLTWNP